MDLQNLQQIIKEFTKEREWGKYHNPKNLAMSVAIEAAEIMELFQWMSITESKEAVKSYPDFKKALSSEIADVLVYLLSLCNATDIDPVAAATDKMKRNKERFPLSSTPRTTQDLVERTLNKANQK